MASVGAAETDLRELVERKLRAAFGAEWFAKCGLTEAEIAEAVKRMGREGTRLAASGASTRPLDFIELGQLLRVIEKNWHLLKGALGNKNTTTAFLGTLASLRLPSAHSRDLLPHELHLLAGIAGYFRNIVTIDRSAMDPSGEFYPVIEKVTDQLGNRFVASESKSGLDFLVRTTIRLEVGQTLTFACVGWDPQGRDLTWTLGKYLLPVRATAHGTEVSLEYLLGREDVGEVIHFEIKATSAGEFHRSGSYDDHVVMQYAVNPPRP
jgi:hypothetical protein